jgi:hypothetical protein
MKGRQIENDWHKPERTRSIGAFFLCYFLFLGCYRYYLRGIVGFYELWWACNSALVVAIVGTLSLNRTLIAIAVSMVSLAHSIWYALPIVLFRFCFF